MVWLLYDEGFIDYPVPHGVNVFTAAPRPGFSWGAIARELATFMPGSLQLTGNNSGVIWINGRGSPHGVLMELPALLAAKEAQEVAERITGEKITKCYSVGKSARHILEYVMPPQRDKCGNAPKSVERLLQGITYGFHACTPGVYQNVTMLDVSGYYFNMLRRLKSLVVTVDDDGLLWHPMKPDEWERWGYVLEGIRDYKPLRNTLAGVCAGSTKPTILWTFDKEKNRVVRKVKKPKAGLFRGAGLLCVHAGSVLCKKEHLTSESVYSTIDCVTTAANGGTIWKRYGFQVGVKHDQTGKPATGKAIICHRGSYRIGEVETKPFADGMVDYGKPEQGMDFPRTEYTEWLLEG